MLRLRQLYQAGQEARQGLAAARRRDQQGGTASARCLQHLQLVTVWQPAFAGEPVLEATWQVAREFESGLKSHD